METISRLARRFGLSRSALLYYDRLGLLQPSSRSDRSHRRYGAADVRRLELICLYRSAGVPLATIRGILDGPRSALGEALERRLASLQAELAALRAQQDVALRILERPDLALRYRGLDKDGWVSILRAVGLDEPAMRRWHAAFEQAAPEAHHGFLESLRIPAQEIDRIRRGARGAGRRR